MELNLDLICQTEAFLKETFQNSPLWISDFGGCAYRLEHSYRVANLGIEIAQRESLHPTYMAMACLLHDIAYSQPLDTQEARRNHGRLSAQLARPFLESLGISHQWVQEICYGIAIHVDGQADFEGEATSFTETISDADNLDRFDVYRIYETLHYHGFQDLALAEKKENVESMLLSLQKLKTMPLATMTANTLWQERMDFYISFYERLKKQLGCSAGIIQI